MGFIYYKRNKECSSDAKLSINKDINKNEHRVSHAYSAECHRGGCSSGGGAAHLLLYCLYYAKSQQQLEALYI